MTEHEVEQLPDAASGETLRIVDRSGKGFTFFALELAYAPAYGSSTAPTWLRIAVHDTLAEAREDARL